MQRLQVKELYNFFNLFCMYVSVHLPVGVCVCACKYACVSVCTLVQVCDFREGKA